MLSVTQLIEGTYTFDEDSGILTLLGYPALSITRSVHVSPGASISLEMTAYRDAQVVTASSFLHPENMRKWDITDNELGPCLYHYRNTTIHTDVEGTQTDDDAEL